jgi:uncharacterized Zn finger protein (UPF0148 family)
MPALFTHTLTFGCPGCEQSVEVVQISREANPEGIDAQPIHLECRGCKKSYELPGWKARIHSVKEWRRDA